MGEPGEASKQQPPNWLPKCRRGRCRRCTTAANLEILHGYSNCQFVSMMPTQHGRCTSYTPRRPSPVPAVTNQNITAETDLPGLHKLPSTEGCLKLHGLLHDAIIIMHIISMPVEHIIKCPSFLSTSPASYPHTESHSHHTIHHNQLR